MTVTKHQALQNFYEDVHKTIRNPFFEACSVDGCIGCREECPTPCEPHNRNRAVTLLPYERLFIQEKTGRKIPEGDVAVPAGKRCPFHTEVGRCGLGRWKPLSCKSFPAFFYCEVPNAIDVYFHTYCPLLSRMGVATKAHIDICLGVVIGLTPHISPHWWRNISSVPMGDFQGRASFDLTDSVLNYDETVSELLCEELYDPMCGFECDLGIVYLNGDFQTCGCVYNRLKDLEVKTDNHKELADGDEE